MAARFRSYFLGTVRRKICLLEFTRPADLHVDQLQAARLRKETKYGPIKLALLGYETKGWQVQVLPWIVGILGMVLTEELQAIASFLNIPNTAWQTLIDCSVTASVEALAFMHRVRYARSSETHLSDSNASTSGPNQTPVAHAAECSSLRKRSRAALQSDDLRTVWDRWKRMTTTQHHQQLATTMTEPCLTLYLTGTSQP